MEIHVRASDRHRHHHDGDPAYDSVILHVVDVSDAVIARSNGETIPQMILPRREDLERRYRSLVERADLDIPCAPMLAGLDSLRRRSWLTTLAYERLYDKESRISDLLSRLGGDYEQATYVTVARCPGFSVNADPFERLALSTPLQVMGKHSDSIMTLEAILFGQSGLLDAPSAAGDPYASELMGEYRFMTRKFGLRAPVSPGLEDGPHASCQFPAPAHSHTRRHACRRLQDALAAAGLGHARAGAQALRSPSCRPTGIPTTPLAELRWPMRAGA